MKLASGSLRLLFEFLDLVAPKNDRLIIIGSNSGKLSSGSTRALEEYLRKRHPEYQVESYFPFRKSGSKDTLTYMIRFIPRMLTARTLICSHGPYDFFPFFWWSRRKILINLWHGIPLKSLGHADTGEDKRNTRLMNNLNSRTTFLIVSSNLEKDLMTKVFSIRRERLRCLGQPRNDILLNDERNSFPIKIPKNEMLILYAPTFRRYAETKFFPFDDFDLEDLNGFLKKHGLVILLRGHISERGKLEGFFSERVIDFGFNVCDDIYSVMRSIDLIITDYSSIYLDYLLLNRPCMFIPYDLDIYRNMRGLLLDDYDFWTPGPKINTYEEFKRTLLEIKNGADHYSDRREQLREIFHSCQIGNSCERIVSLIKETLGSK
ncbi:MAG: CDP-glycerol glycerophosphotransferase family protein [Candidatus Syntropharchaeales archaeon]